VRRERAHQPASAGFGAALCPGRVELAYAFSLISGNAKGLFIGSYVHLSAYVSILGADQTTIEDFCTISVRCSLFTSNDDYSGLGLTNPTVPSKYRSATDGPVHLKKHCIIGAGSIVLPNVTVGRSAAVGALTLVKTNVEDYAIVAGTPMRRLGTRRREHIVKEEELRCSDETWLKGKLKT
jgi:dTDP-4-amino-4,6-dideoxy-D-glucose acyltransferase